MGTNFEDFMADDESMNTPEVRAMQEVFRPRYQLATQLIGLREKRGLSQSELARRTGIHQTEISRIERGSGNPTERTLLRLADALNADLQLVERDYTSAAS